ncbi:MAG: hypothetical protein R6U57_12515 [Anaerolineales bacterium]
MRFIPLVWILHGMGPRDNHPSLIPSFSPQDPTNALITILIEAGRGEFGKNAIL